MDQKTMPNPQNAIVHIHHLNIPPAVFKISLAVLYVLCFFLGIGVTLFFQSLHTPKGQITVKGVGTVFIDPSEALIKATVSTSNPDQTTAITDNKQEVAKITQQLSAFGIGQQDIATVTNTIQPYPAPSQSPGIPNFYYSSSCYRIYELQNTQVQAGIKIQGNPNYCILTTMTISIKKNLSTSVNQVISILRSDQNVTLDSTNPNTSYYIYNNGALYSYNQKLLETFLDQARTIAIKDAKNQAEKELKINNSRLGKLVSITDTSDTSTYPILSQNGAPILRGVNLGLNLSIPITASYSITYEQD